MERKTYPSDMSDEEWAFAASYLTLMTEDAPQREHRLREVFNGLRWIVRAGAPWRMMPNDLTPWYRVYQRTQRWIAAGVFEAIVIPTVHGWLKRWQRDGIEGLANKPKSGRPAKADDEYNQALERLLEQEPKEFSSIGFWSFGYRRTVLT